MKATQAARLRDVLLDPLEAAAIVVPGSATAAVLVPLYERGDDLIAVFTQRRDDLRRHAGQISFPGGARDRNDRALTDTALREAHEEIGLAPDAVTLLGALTPITVPASDFALYPFVATIDRPDEWAIAEREVEAVLELSLAELARNFGKKEITRADHTSKTDTYTCGGHFIWGATARILTDLLGRMRGLSA
jgi:8-oxo-dGTP pyrophosphatase MutT (NUDIX family)